MKKYFLLALVIALLSLNVFTAQGEFKEDKESLKLPKPLLRMQAFDQQRAYPYAEIPFGARPKAFTQMNQMYNTKNKSAVLLAQQPEWRLIGPYNVGGRIKSVVHHPTQNGLVYIAAAAGGIWKTTDAGNTWEPIFDYENAISFGALAMDMNNPEVLYAGTGEAVIGGGNIYLGAGLFKTTDAGENWNIIGLTDVGAFSKVWVHPMNSDLVIASAVMRGQGVYFSMDAGSSWERKYQGPVTDLTINPNNMNEYIIGVRGVGVLYTSDGGNNWVNRSNGLPDDYLIGRVSVQFAPSNTDIAYCLLEESGEGKIYKTTNKGVNWTLSYIGGDSFFNGQGFYNNYITVNPVDPNHCLAGGIDIFRTIDGGRIWNNVTYGYSGGNVHVDQHHACYNPQSPNTIYAGNDGGMYRSIDGGYEWVDINTGLSVTQFYALAVDQSHESKNYGGTQDNGTLGNISDPYWGRIAGGDGFSVVVDPDNPNILYGEYYNGSLWKRDLAKGTLQGLTNGIPANDPGAWHSPLIMDPFDSYVLYHGRTSLYYTLDKGNNWDAMTERQDSKLTSIAVSKVLPDIIYAGTETGKVIVTTNWGETWTDVSKNGLISRYVTDIETSRHDEETAWITFSGFGNQNLFKTTDAGQSWRNIGTGLPNIPCNTVAIHPEDENMLWVGTDIGVFCSFDAGVTWFPYGRTLPRSPVVDLVFREDIVKFPNLVLRAATHGRSMWEVDIPGKDVFDPAITAPAGGELYISDTKMTIAWYGFKMPVNIEYSLNDGQSWKPIQQQPSGNYIDWQIPNYPTNNARIRISSDDGEQMLVSNTFTIILKQRGSVLKQAGVTYVPYGIAWDGKDGLWSTSFYSNKFSKLNAHTFAVEKEIHLPGDSLFTDLTMDREAGLLYIHRMNNTQSGGGKILVVDTLGNKIREMNTPATHYPIGIELVDGKLVIADRDGRRMIWTMDPESGEVFGEVKNPFDKNYGPRGVCYDGKQYIYQVSTYFPSNGGALSEAYLLKIDKNDLGTEADRISLESLDGLINARGVDYDSEDGNFWVTDFGGNLYKIAGFDTKSEVGTEDLSDYNSGLRAEIFPNPMSDFANISYTSSQNIDNIRIDIVNVLGEIITTVADKKHLTGSSDVFHIQGEKLPSGIYNVVFTVNNKKALTKKLVVIH